VALIPSLTISVNLINWVITRTVKPRPLPKMDFREGLPAECTTLVVIPALLSSSDEVKSLLHQLELHFLRNPDPRLYFALLSDFSDADSQHLPEDVALLEEAQRGIRSLNEKYGPGKDGYFFLFHRERRWSPAERRWIGWERGGNCRANWVILRLPAWYTVSKVLRVQR
jgi:cyclic beta-1,2-glucan synthetase